jgi:hypothetical protein
MSDPTNDPELPQHRRHDESEDPHYHDEDSEIQNADRERWRWPLKRKDNRRWPPRRHYED